MFATKIFTTRDLSHNPHQIASYVYVMSVCWFACVENGVYCMK